MAYPKPITRKEMYLAKAIGEYEHATPRPVTRIDTYWGNICGDWDFPIPAPLTREEMYLAKIAGGYDYPTPTPITRIDFFLAAITGDYDGELPVPITREEIYLAALVEKTGYVVRYAKGNPITLTDSVYAPFQSLSIRGRTTQQTTTGAQLYAGSDLTNEWRYDDADSNTNRFVIRLEAGDLFGNGGYISFTSNIDVMEKVNIQLLGANGNLGTNWSASTQGNIVSGFNQFLLKPYNFADNQDSVSIQIRRDKSNDTEYAQVITLSNIFVKSGQDAMDYEPYTGGKPSPSPDYPQEIVSAGQYMTNGAQLLDLSKAFSGWIRDDGSINKLGAIGSYDNVVSDYISCKPGETYCINCNYAWLYRSDKTFIEKATVKNQIIEIPEEAAWFIAAVSCNMATAVAKASSWMINAGSVALPWEPYTGGVPAPANKGIDVSVYNNGYAAKGMNFYNVRKVALKKGNYLTLKNNYNGNIMNAFVFDDENFLVNNNVDNNASSLYNAFVALGATEVISDGGTITGRVRLAPNWHTPITYKVGADGLYLYYANNREEDDSEECYVWFTDGEGSTETEVDMQSLSISTPNGLLGIPVTTGGNYTDKNGKQWVCDEIDLDRGVYVQRVKEYEVTGEENIADFGANENTGKMSITIEEMYNDAGNHAYQKAVMSKQYIRSSFAALGVGNIACGQQHNVVIGVSPETTIEDFTAWLKQRYEDGEPVVVLIRLQSPVEHALTAAEITAYKSLHTYTPTTTVANDADAWMNVWYKAKPVSMYRARRKMVQTDGEEGV